MGAEKQIQQKILDYLAQQDGGVHAVHIAQSIGHNRITVGKYLDILKAANKVEVRSVGQANLWSIVRAQQKKTVLIVDDEPPVINLIALTLGEEHYTLLTANNGVEALEQVSQHMPDLIVLDIMMPKMNGFDVCKTIKENILTRNIVVVLLSAKAQTSDKVKGMQVGADHYMVKPFDPEELEALVASLLQKQQTQQIKHPLTGLDQGAVVLSAVSDAKQDPNKKAICLHIIGFQDIVENAGFKKGMHVLQMMVKIIQSQMEKHGRIDDYLGHIDDDKFILITSANDKQLAQSIQQEFAGALPFLLVGKSLDSVTLDVQVVAWDTIAG